MCKDENTYIAMLWSYEKTKPKQYLWNCRNSTSYSHKIRFCESTFTSHYLSSKGLSPSACLRSVGVLERETSTL